MATITNIRVYPSTGSLNLLIQLENGSQDQGGEIDADGTAANIIAGAVANLTDGNKYRITYTSVRNDYNVQKKYEAEYGSTTLHFIPIDG